MEEICSGCGTPLSKGREYVKQGMHGCCPDMPGASSFVEISKPTRPQTVPADVVRAEFNRLMGLVNNLLIDNKNLKSTQTEQAYYLRVYPTTREFVREVLTDHAEYILEQLKVSKELCADMAITQEEQELLHGRIISRLGS